MDEVDTKIKLNKPPTFDGSYSKYRSWLQKVELFHRGHKITNDEQKIITMLSYMTKGPALDWCQAFTDHALTNDNFGTWNTFKSSLDHRFKDQATREKTREKLKTFRQDRQHIDEFIANLERFFHDAELTDESEKICVLQKAIHRDLLQCVFTQTPLPDKYEEWKAKVLTLGQLQERFNQQFGSCSMTSSTAPSRVPHTFVTNINTPAEKKTGTGTTFIGAGQPMEVDKLHQDIKCLNCNETGHMYVSRLPT
jgi:Ty3 transposon capsid-like protein